MKAMIHHLPPDITADYNWNAAGNHMHTHDFWEFFLVLEGETTHVMPQKKIMRLRKNEGYLLRPHDLHRFTKCTDNYSEIILKISTEQFKKIMDTVKPGLYDKALNYSQAVHVVMTPEKTKFFMENINHLSLSADIDKELPSAISFLFLYIINMVTRTHNFENNYPPWLANFITEIHKPENIQLKSSEIWRLSNYSHSHLIREFQKHTGQKPSDYIKDVKLNYAATLLKRSNLSVLQISSNVGYDSTSHFIRSFTTKFNLSPMQYKSVNKPATKVKK